MIKGSLIMVDKKPDLEQLRTVFLQSDIINANYIETVANAEIIS